MAVAGKKYNILYVSPFSQEISGADESLTLIIKGLDKELFTPFVALPGSSPYLKRFEEAGASIIKFNFERIRRTTNPLHYLKYLVLFIPDVLRFIRLIKKHRIDLVHTNMEVVLSSGVAAKLCRVKSIYHYRHNTYDKPKLVYDIFIRVLARLSDTVFVISRAVGEAFYKRGIKDKARVLYNVIETARFFNEKRTDFFEKSFGAKRSEKIVCTVGRINRRKNLEDFVRMAKIITGKRGDTRFFIVGEAHFKGELAYKQQILSLVKDLGLEDKVVFAGKHGAVQYVMNSADIVTLSSYHEGFGRVLVEAMACAKPLVGSDSGAIPEVMDYCECGVIYPVSDHKGFADAVLKLLDDPDECKRLGAAGRKRVAEKFTLESQKKEMDGVMRSLLGIH